MPSITRAPRRPRLDLARMGGRIRYLILVLELASQIWRERRMLLSMNDRALNDIGFSSSDAYAEARRPFWDIPCDRLHM
jgi:uncharacterized protein YjiS (DUF1127 family)